jgi:hypothetical protein
MLWRALVHSHSAQTYTVMDGDIIFFKFNAGGGLTKGKK